MADLTAMLQAAAGAAVQPSGYEISRSLRFNSADSAYLSRTPGTAGNRKTFTWSGWVKRTGLSTRQPFLISTDGVGNNYTELFFDSDNTIRFVSYNSGAKVLDRNTTAVYRDVSSFYHIVVAFDMTDATASNRQRLYVNGTEVTAFTNTTTLAQNSDTWINYTQAHEIFRQGLLSIYGNCYLADVYFVDGQALTPSDFGETDATTGVWKPKAYAGTYGTNGFHLDFSDNTSTTTIGYDAAGSNDWTANNFSVAAGAGNDSLVDTPTPYGTDTGAGGEVRGNYCTLNPLDTGLTLSQGNLGFAPPSGSTVFRNARSTVFTNSNKWYWEVTCNTYVTGGAPWMFGVTTSKASLVGVGFGGDIAASGTDGSAYSSDGNKRQNGTNTAYGSTFTTGDVIGVALDMDNGKIWFSKNGTWQASGDPAAGTNAAFTNLAGLNLTPAVSLYAAETSGVAYVNFGQRPFEYTAPSGFKALCTQNLPDPTIVQGDDYFNTVLYTGTGSSQSITGVGFQPDWVWIKERSGAADHGLYDAVRGVQEQLESNTTTAETTESTGLTAFGSDGFTVGSLAQLNTNTDTYVAWNWNAGGSNATNTDGTITSTVRANTTSGFSIVSFTGPVTTSTVGHGLGVAPKMIILKNRDQGAAGYRWCVYHTSIGNTQAVFLDGTNAAGANIAYWGNTTPTSTVFTVGTAIITGAEKMIAYCFAEVEGYSKFGSYTGNGSADGPFVYCGFRPAFVMFKNASATLDWLIRDASRDTYNTTVRHLKPNSSAAEVVSASTFVDFLSNGFKVRNSDVGFNGSTNTMIFAAFSQNPFKYSLAR
jgi:hypothetical protein